MSWFDGFGSGVGSLVDMFAGTPSGTTAAGASAAATHIAGSGTAQSAGKLTGLTPYMSLLGMTPAAPASTSTAGGASSSTAMVANHDHNGFERDPAGGFKLPSYANWGGSGTSAGNRQADVDAQKEAVKLAAPEIYQPDLSKLDVTTVGQKSISQAGKGENVTGAGRFTDTAWGSHTDAPEWGIKTTVGADGKGSTTLASGGYQAGGIYRDGYRAVAMSDDKRYTADAEAGIVAQGGVSGSYGLDTKNGAYATGGIGGKIGAYGQANADAKSESVKIGGVDYDMGAGAHGEVFAGAKAGAGGTIGIGPDFVGAKGNIGAFIGAEAAGDIHANLGPLAGKLGASGMVGAGIGADGDISYKDGKFHIGGKMFAALGYGGSLSGDVTVDVGAIGKTLYNGAGTVADYAGKGLSAAGDYASKGLNAAGGAIYDGASAVGGAISNGASAVGGAISSGASSIYNGAANLFSW